MDADVSLQFKKIAEALDRKMNAKAKVHGLTTAQCRVLYYLMENPGRKVTQRDLESYLGATHVTVSGIICRMKLHGFIKVTTDTRDRRAKLITLSDGRRKSLGTMSSDAELFTRSLTDGFTDEELAELMRLLNKLYENVCADDKKSQEREDKERPNA